MATPDEPGELDEDAVVDLTDAALQAREINGRDFAILSRLRARR